MIDSRDFLREVEKEEEEEEEQEEQEEEEDHKLRDALLRPFAVK